jgi:PPK2 family polyphosphate:nucleotide phosphotransferase
MVLEASFHMKIDTNRFLVPPDSNLSLESFPTSIRPLYSNKADYESKLDETRAELRDLQQLLYAHDRYSLLLIFQGMDTSGKDGAIKHVFSGVNPQGFQVYSFQKPGPEDLEHDFMWRCVKCLPERGRIGLFNRSYYEEVLVVRVHPELLHFQKLPEELITDNIWKERLKDIANFEEYLVRNGTKVIKFFLNISNEEQRKRLLARLDDETKNWKFSVQDIEERAYWNDYMKAYKECLESTSTASAPWYIIPGDDKKNARLIISEIVAEHLRNLDIAFPEVTRERKAELKKMRKQLEK